MVGLEVNVGTVSGVALLVAVAIGTTTNEETPLSTFY